MPSFLQSLKYSFPPHCGLVFPDVWCFMLKKKEHEHLGIIW
jgi:hypothetical protein